MYQVPIKNHTNADVSLHEAGNLFNLHWELSLKVRLNQRIKSNWKDVRQRFMNLVTRVHNSWIEMKKRLSDLYSQTREMLHSSFYHSVNTTLYKRNLQETYKQLWNDLQNQMKNSPAFLHLIKGGKLQDPSFSNSDSIHSIKLKKDSFIELSIPIQVVEFDGQEYVTRYQILQQAIDFEDQNSVQNGFESLKNKTIHLFSISLQRGTNLP